MTDDDLEHDDLQDQEVVEAEEAAEEPVEAEKDESQEDELDEQPQRRSRSNDRIRNLREERIRERERADDLERQLNSLREEFSRNQQYLDQQAQQQRMAEMTPEERMYHELQQTKQQVETFQKQQQFLTMDQNDRVSFEAIAEKLPPLKKIAPQVEQELSGLRQKLGWNVPRRMVAAQLLGLQALQELESGYGKAKKTGQTNIQRQRTSPSGGESNVRRSSGREDPNSPEARRKRLEDAVF
jgi:hypothetical protein